MKLHINMKLDMNTSKHVLWYVFGLRENSMLRFYVFRGSSSENASNLIMLSLHKT